MPWQERDLPSREELKIHWFSSPERSKLPFVLVLDIGSTKISGGIFNLERREANPSTRIFISYPQEVIFPFNLKYTDWQETGPKVMSFVYSLLWEEEISAADLKGVVITGLTNSLAVSWGNKTIIILDEPSLRASVLEEQQEILERHLGIREPRPISSLTKILALKNNPEIIKFLFGPEARFEQLRFNTFLGLVTQSLTEIPGIPLADLYGFNTHRRKEEEEMEKLMALLSELGICSEQLQFWRQEIWEEGDFFVAVVNDFEAESGFFALFWQKGILSPADILVSTDSVGKIIGFGNSLQGDFKRLETLLSGFGVGYLTQRMTGNVYGGWIMPLLVDIFPVQEMNGNFFKTVNEILGEGLEEEETCYFYYPEDPQGLSDKGALYFWQNGEAVRIEIEELTNKSIEERKRAIRAIARGVFFGIREKIESVRREKGRIIFYGGIIQNPNWRKTIAQCFGGLESKIFFVDLAYGGEAALSVVAARMERNFELPSLNFEEVLTKETRVGEYHSWKILKAGREKNF